ncbi:MAG: hypothetical protein AB1611_08400 [bacterium]
MRAAVSQVAFTDYTTSITRAIDLIGAAGRLPSSGLIIIKLNLTKASNAAGNDRCQGSRGGLPLLPPALTSQDRHWRPIPSSEF